MLNRRFLRIKAMQSLYAFFQAKNDNITNGERELLKNINKIYDLYLYQLSMLVEIVSLAERTTDDAKLKYLPTEEEINPNIRFINNRFIKHINTNISFQKEVHNRMISWSNEPELIKKIYNTIKVSDEYTAYMKSEKHTYASDRDIIQKLYKKYIGDFPDLLQFYEEKSIFWYEDIEIAHLMVLKTFKLFNDKSDETTALAPLFDDAPVGEDHFSEDRKFMIDLFRKTIINNKKFEQLVSEKAKNWEVERIAMIDILLMKMAICEITEFPTIPIKVTFNEYIELSKIYSSAKSKNFINGILDKMVTELKGQGLIKKIGRGLVE
ncbi:MAG: transcription antitermination factor NusB [Bacteroidetes bacterium CG2_30_32_10]|nr:MAG: transcription antitermination factor NusB [Bacteroidetes bacterium CG2_30_32_10]